MTTPESPQVPSPSLPVATPAKTPEEAARQLSYPSSASASEKHERLSEDRGPAARSPQDASTRQPESSKDVQPAGDASPAAAQASTDDPEYEWLSGLKLATMMGPLIFVFFLILLDTTIISTAIPKITDHFNSLEDIGWYSVAYQLSSAVLQPLAGKLYVVFKNKWTFVTFFCLFEVGSLLCGVATSSKMLIVGRAIAGMGTAGLQNGAFTIIAAAVPIHKRPLLIGICQGIAQLGIVFGPLIGGALTEYTTWRWCFYINLPPAAVVLVLLVFTRVPDAHEKPKPLAVLKDLHNKLDLVGFVLFAPAIIMLLLAMQWGGNQYAWDSATIIGLFCGFGGNLVVWAAWNWHKKDAALIPVSMVKKRTVWSACLNIGALMSALYISTYYLPLYFQAIKNASPTMSGVYVLPSIVVGLVLAVTAGRLVGVIGYYTPFSILAGITAAIGYGILSILGPNSPLSDALGFQVIAGISRGVGMQMPMVAIQNRLPPKVAPLAIALGMFSGMLFGSLFLSASATIFTNSLRTLIPKYAPGANVNRIIVAGATGFRAISTPEQLPGILLAYSKGIDRVFYLTSALGVLTLLSAFGLGWTNIKPKEKQKQAAIEQEKQQQQQEGGEAPKESDPERAKETV